MKKFMQNEQGQGLMEYVILSCLIGIFSLVAIKEFGKVIHKRVENMKTHVSKNIDIK